MESREDRKKRLREKLAESIDYSTEKTDEEIQQLIDEILMKESKTAPLSLAERVQLRRELFHAIRKLDVLQDLVDDGHITEIMINGPENIFIEKDGLWSIYWLNPAMSCLLTQRRSSPVLKRKSGFASKGIRRYMPCII